MIRMSTVQKLKVEICESAQSTHQTDVSSPLKVIGETKLPFTRGQHVFQVEGLVVQNLDVEVLAGTPFMTLADGSSTTALLMIALHSKLRVALWFSALPQLQPLYGPEVISNWNSHKVSLQTSSLPWSPAPTFLRSPVECGPLLAFFLAWQEENESQTGQANPFKLNATSTFVRLAPSSPLVLMSSLNTLPTSLSNQSTCRLLHLVPASHQLSALIQTISYSPLCSRHFASS